MTSSSTSFMTVAALLGAFIAGVLAVVLFVAGRSLLAAGLAVIAIASLGTLPAGRRGGGRSC